MSDTRRTEGVAVKSSLSEPASRFAAASCLQSNVLLQGRSSVAIQHNGTIYRLQATKLGKLILTK